ncbi:MAG: hypothetical protein AABX04_06135 [Nanoarchaeota archaeon]
MVKETEPAKGRADPRLDDLIASFKGADFKKALRTMRGTVYTDNGLYHLDGPRVWEESPHVPESDRPSVDHYR